MSQNESADDDIEHFKDIVEETENQAPTTSPEKPDKDVEVANGSDGIDSESDTSLDEGGGSPMSGFEDGDSDEGDELLVGGGGLNDLQATRKMSDLNTIQSKVSGVKKSLLPGGYDPRHREPSYWYVKNNLRSHFPSITSDENPFDCE